MPATGTASAHPTANGAIWADRRDIAPPHPTAADLSRLIRRGFGLGKYRPPPLPDVAVRLLEMARSDDVQFEEVAALIQEDVSIAGEVLRLVNSTYYSRGVEIRSIEQAVGRLGLSGLRELAGQIAVEMSVFASPGYEEAMGRIRRHGTVTAHLTRVVERVIGERDGTFLAALFHDAGLAASVLLVGDVYGEAAPPIDGVWPELLRIHHQVGRHLARGWDLPPYLEHILTTHHTPDDDIGAVVCLADHLAERVGAGVAALEEGGPPPELPNAVFHLLGLEPREVEAMAERAAELVEELD